MRAITTELLRDFGTINKLPQTSAFPINIYVYIYNPFDIHVDVDIDTYYMYLCVYSRETLMAFIENLKLKTVKKVHFFIGLHFDLCVCEKIALFACS